MTDKKPFQLEPRYWVFKRKHLTNGQENILQGLADQLQKNGQQKALVECIVVPASAPHYVETLAATERQWLAEGHGQTGAVPELQEFVWADNEELFTLGDIYPTMDEALEAARWHYAYDDQVPDSNSPCYIGTVVRQHERQFFPTAEDVLGVMREHASNSEAGEHADNAEWLELKHVDVSHRTQLDAELAIVMQNFFNRHPQYKPHDKFFVVDNIDPVDLTAQES